MFSPANITHEPIEAIFDRFREQSVTGEPHDSTLGRRQVQFVLDVFVVFGDLRLLHCKAAHFWVVTGTPGRRNIIQVWTWSWRRQINQLSNPHGLLVSVDAGPVARLKPAVIPAEVFLTEAEADLVRLRLVNEHGQVEV